jgi:hypothetical protein
VLAPVPMQARAGPDLTSVPVHAEGAAAVRAFPGIRPALHPAVRAASFHDDAPAHAAAAALGVHAFTFESSIFFARGRLAPETPQGRALLEHELEHVQRGEGRGGRTIEAWSSGGHRTITLKALAGDRRFSASAQMLLANTAPELDYNRMQIINDMVGYWAGMGDKGPTVHEAGALRVTTFGDPRWLAGAVGGAVAGAFTPSDQGAELAPDVRVGGMLPGAVIGSGLVSTLPAERAAAAQPPHQRELTAGRIPQELANHGEGTPAENEERMMEYVRQGASTANDCNLYGGLVQLGYAFHVAQDRASHGEGYTRSYVRGLEHEAIDAAPPGSEAYLSAIANTRRTADAFCATLVPLKLRMLSDDPLLGQTVPTSPPPILQPGSQPPQPFDQPPDRRLSPTLNVFSVTFP